MQWPCPPIVVVGGSLTKGTYTLPDVTSPVATGNYYLSGRYGAVARFDNIIITAEEGNESMISSPRLQTAVRMTSSDLYNLNGQRVNFTRPGIYIRHGQKVLIK